jgi:hypothetical protein
MVYLVVEMTKHEITISNPAKEKWISLDLPLSSFTGLTTRSHIAQIIFFVAHQERQLFIDNVFF